MRLRRWIFWVFFFIGLTMLVSALGVYWLLHSFAIAAPRVTAGTTLTLGVSGDLPEDTLYDVGAGLFGVERVTLRDVVGAIARAKEDARIENLLLEVRGATFGWAKAEELRSALVDFKRSGKKLVAYIEYGGNLDYFLSSAADAVYMHPQSLLDLRGIQAEVTFVRSTLEKLGIEAEFEQIGPYKNAPDTFTRDSLSDAHREVLESIVDDLYARFVSSLAKARGMDESQVKQLLDRGPFLAREAKELGLVDGLRYRDEVEQELRRLGRDFHGVAVPAYEQQAADGLALVGRPKLALVYGVGTIVGGENGEDPLMGRIMGSDTLAKAFKAIREDSSIRAVVFRIDSPGGSDVASDVIWREAQRTKQAKPVVVSMSNVAASGGYWIATASNAIVAEPTTLTGSIGIYAGKFNVRGLYEKVGLHKQRVMKGKSADFWSDTRRFRDEERLRMRTILEEGYRHFLKKVADARNKTEEEVDAVAQGRVWTGSQALERGLVDELGGLESAVALAKQKAGIAQTQRVTLEIYPRKKSFLEAVVSKMVTGVPVIVEGVNPQRLLERSPVLRMLFTGERLAWMPFHIELR